MESKKNLVNTDKLSKYIYRLQKAYILNNSSKANEYFNHFKHHVMVGGDLAGDIQTALQSIEGVLQAMDTPGNPLNVGQLRADKDDLLQQRNKLSGEKKDLAAQLKHATTGFDTVNIKNTQLTQERDGLIQANGTLRQERDGLAGENSNLRGQLGQRDGEIQDLTTRLQQETQRAEVNLAEYQRASLDLLRVTDERDNLVRENKKEKAAKIAEQTKYNECQKRLYQSVQTIGQIRQELVDARNALATATTKGTSDSEQIRLIRDQLTAAELGRQKADAAVATIQAVLDAVRAELADRKVELEQLRTDNEQVKEQRDNLVVGSSGLYEEITASEVRLRVLVESIRRIIGKIAPGLNVDTIIPQLPGPQIRNAPASADQLNEARASIQARTTAAAAQQQAQQQQAQQQQAQQAQQQQARQDLERRAITQINTLPGLQPKLISRNTGAKRRTEQRKVAIEQWYNSLPAGSEFKQLGLQFFIKQAGGGLESSDESSDYELTSD